MIDDFMNIIDAIGTIGPLAIAGMVLVVLGYTVKHLWTFFSGKLVNSEAISVALNVVQDVVSYLNVNVVNALKLAAADGHLTEEEAKQIKEAAINQIMKILSSNMKDVLGAVFGDIGEWLSIQVDNVTEALKNDPNGSGLTHDQVMIQKALAAGTTTTTTEDDDEPSSDRSDMYVGSTETSETTDDTTVETETPVVEEVKEEPTPIETKTEEEKDESIFEKLIDTVGDVTGVVGDVADAVTTVASNFNPVKSSQSLINKLLDKAFGKK